MKSGNWKEPFAVIIVVLLLAALVWATMATSETEERPGKPRIEGAGDPNMEGRR